MTTPKRGNYAWIERTKGQWLKAIVTAYDAETDRLDFEYVGENYSELDSRFPWTTPRDIVLDGPGFLLLRFGGIARRDPALNGADKPED